ncbi:ribosome small subunit-dependent GTPase A [Pseudolysinimonas sp.]|uniref:ribosome small subunit-dependent GTPase A n=1 Tax=Pseudolysinimonas sp. TaxID=2680009 RepID=UPI003F7EE9CE
MSWLPPDDEDDDAFGFDESDVRIRPNPKGTRPRTKTRPDHGDAVVGRVLSVDRGRYTVMADEDGAEERVITTTRARELRREAIVTGDRVDVVGDTTGEEGTLARIVRIRPRTTLLRRSADDTDQVERVIVANADQLMIVIAAADPEPRARLVDRYLVAAYDAGIAPLIVVTKTDLADPGPFLANFAALDVPVVRSARGAWPLAELAPILDGHTTVAVGHSGVGKSTLVNALVPGTDRAVGVVNAVTGRGRHTSSSTVSLRVPTGGWIIDTPGVRSFGLGHIDPANVLRAFTDLAEVAADCPRGCTHLADAPDCALDEAVASGRLRADRVDDFRRLLSSLAG